MLSFYSNFSLEQMRIHAKKEGGLPFLIEEEAMEPYLLKKDIAYIQWVEPKEIKLGDVVLVFLSLHNPVIRRVVRKRVRNNNYYFIIKGDNNLYPDLEIPSSQLVGKVIRLKRRESIVKDINDIERDKGLWRKRRLIFKGVELGKLWIFDNFLANLLYLFQKFLLLIKNKKKSFKDQKVIYRNATKEDAFSIARLMCYYHWPTSFKKIEKMYTNELRDNSNFFIVAQSNSKIIGIYLLHNFGISSEGYNIFSPGIIYVHWKYRNYGVGSNLKIFMWKENLQNFQKIKFIASGYEKTIFGCHFSSYFLRALKLSTITDSIIAELESGLSKVGGGKMFKFTIFVDKNKSSNCPPRIIVSETYVENIEKKLKELFSGREQ